MSNILLRNIKFLFRFSNEIYPNLPADALASNGAIFSKHRLDAKSKIQPTRNMLFVAETTQSPHVWLWEALLMLLYYSAIVKIFQWDTRVDVKPHENGACSCVWMISTNIQLKISFLVETSQTIRWN